MEFADKLKDAMDKENVHIDGEINWFSSDFQRFSSKNHWNRKKHLFVILFQGGASFGDWRDPGSWKTIWEKSWRELEREEKLQRAREMELLKHQKELIRNHAIWRCKLLLSHKTWRGETCHDASLSQKYVREKRIIPYYGKQIRSYLVLPVTDLDGNLQSIQFIKPCGFKRFKKNTSPKGGMIILSDKLSKNYSGDIFICEGYATGCSIKEAIDAPVICTLGASNLLAVSLEIRSKYVFSTLHICSDNDQYSPDNIGVTVGKEAANLTGGILHYPMFKESDLLKKPTDFNDLLCIYGIEEVEKQLSIVRK